MDMVTLGADISKQGWEEQRIRISSGDFSSISFVMTRFLCQNVGTNGYDTHNCVNSAQFD